MYEIITILLVMASVFGFINYRVFKLPPAIAMVVASLVSSFCIMGFDSLNPGLQIGFQVRKALTSLDFSRLLMNGMLSFLLFAGALHVDLGTLRQKKKTIALLAVGSTGISTAIIGFSSYFIFQAFGIDISMAYCLVFGALISPTDPIAVLGIMKSVGAPKDLEIKIVGESLFNDGLGVVIFVLLLSLAGGAAGHSAHAMDASGIAILVLQEVVGGIVLGLVAGVMAYYAIARVDEPNLETLMSFALVMGLTSVAFELHTSAPLAAVVAGLFIGNRGRLFAMESKTRVALDTIWAFIDETLNAILFLLIGLELLAMDFDTPQFKVAIVLLVVCLLARFIAVGIPLTILKQDKKKPLLKGTTRIVAWGGLKGGISVALALSLPPFPGRKYVLTATYLVVITSILLQGLTIGPLIKKLVPAELLRNNDDH